MQVADVQRNVAAAILNRTVPRSIAIVGGGDPAQRFAIHSRHYAASVTRAIVERFAATVWLVGSDSIVRAAAAFVREHPPTRPCMAEYGEAFPAFLAAIADQTLPPYASQFAELDWQLGRLAIEVDVPPIARLAGCDAEHVGDARLTVQPGLAYLHADWSIDEVATFYLSGDAPASYTIRREPLWLELRGSRGELSLRRLALGEFTFRRALAGGATLGDAATRAASVDLTFNPTEALPRLLADGLATAVRQREIHS